MSGRRVTVVASELLGRPGTGGAGTADSLLAVALGRNGHDVRLLIATGRDAGPPSGEWARIYDSANVEIRRVDPLPNVEPSYLARPLEVFHALHDEPPDVVVTNDWRGLGYTALRSREAERALSDTAFVVQCHGPSRMLAEFAHKVPDRLARFGQEVTERASIQLADAVVSPSAWLLDWMRARQWPLPGSAAVIQYVRRSAALGEEPVRQPPSPEIRRVAFFGQLREGKGIRIFLAALERLDPQLLANREVVFLGRASRRWPATEIEDAVRSRVASVRVETDLDRDGAIGELLEPGTLAVMPSLLDNSPNTVSECIEHGVPFIATSTGGIPELIGEDDRARVLCEPNADDLAATLGGALTSDGFAPARPARDARESVEAWLALIDSIEPPARPHARPPARVSIVASGESVARAERLAQTTRSVEVDVVDASSRARGLERAAADWLVFLDDDDLPDDDFVDTLAAVQAATNADVVTAGVRVPDGSLRLFLGDPRALGLVENQYGVVGLVRKDLVRWVPEDGDDADWPLFARLALAGGRVVSLQQPLAAHLGRPGQASDVPGHGLTVLAAFEEHGSELHDLPQLAATLAAANDRLASTPQADGRTSLTRRLLRRL
jgi:O-antigen biosynthesis protein